MPLRPSMRSCLHGTGLALFLLAGTPPWSAGGQTPAAVPFARVPGGTGTALLVASGDSVWVGHAEGIALWVGDRWTRVPGTPAGRAASVTRSADGRIWATVENHLFEWTGGRWVERLDASGECVAPLLLGPTDRELLGACSYYPYLLAGPPFPGAAGGSTPELIPFPVRAPRRILAVGGETFVLPGGFPDEQILRLTPPSDPSSADSWTLLALPAGAAGQTIASIAAGPEGVFTAVGTAGLVLRGTPDHWTSEDTGVEADLLDLWTDADGIAYAVGRAGVIIRRGAEGWSRVDVDTAEDLVAVHGNGRRTVVLGSGGTLFDVRPHPAGGH